MSLIPVSRVTGLREPRLGDLLEGRARPGAGERLGVSASAVQSFIDGRATTEIGEGLGVGRMAAQTLRDSLGPEGAIGLILGLSFQQERSQPI